MLTLNAPAAVEQRADISLDCAIANELVPNEVSVMRGRNVVVPKRSCHIMMNRLILVSEGRVRRGK